MVDALGTPLALKRLIQTVRPPFPGALHPRTSMERAALGRPATRGILRVRPAEPLLPRTLDAVGLALGNHQMGMRVVRAPVRVEAGVDGQGVRQVLLVG